MLTGKLHSQVWTAGCEHILCYWGSAGNWNLISWFQRLCISLSHSLVIHSSYLCWCLSQSLSLVVFPINFTLVFSKWGSLLSLLTHSLVRLSVGPWRMNTDYLKICFFVSTNRAKAVSFQFGNPNDKCHSHRELKFINWTKQAHFFSLEHITINF